jgi:transcriptional regulator with XRE-family HTH domain
MTLTLPQGGRILHLNVPATRPAMLNTDQLYALIGKRIAEIREAQDPRVSQDDLAKVLGLKRTSVTNIEKGNQKLTLEAIYRICERFGLEVGDLLPAVSDVVLPTAQPIVVGGKAHDLDVMTAAALERARQQRRSH